VSRQRFTLLAESLEGAPGAWEGKALFSNITQNSSKQEKISFPKDNDC